MSSWDELASRKAYEAELRAMLSRCQESAVEIATENAALRQIIREALRMVAVWREFGAEKAGIHDPRPEGVPVGAGEELLARMRAAIEGG